jgi:hypothetical protein
VIIQAWRAAEQSLIRDIQYCYPDADEEFITRTFHGKYAATLNYASQLKQIEKAFLYDLQKAFPGLDSPLKKIASGLIAEVTLHSRTTEKITGGDIGLMFSRPQISARGHYLQIADYRRGLLCQAKLKNVAGKWGSFTKKQIKVLPDRLPYLGLLLYSYSDNARHVLNPFQWQLCNTATMDEVRGWLKKGNFPSSVDSDGILTDLAEGAIGSDDDEVIDSIIAPAKNPTLHIRITWPDDQHPGSSVQVYSRQENKAKQTVTVRQS